MFFRAEAFNQDLSGWNVEGVEYFGDLSIGDCPLPGPHHPDPGWVEQEK